jgi:hypothetical protein
MNWKWANDKPGWVPSYMGLSIVSFILGLVGCMGSVHASPLSLALSYLLSMDLSRFPFACSLGYSDYATTPQRGTPRTDVLQRSMVTLHGMSNASTARPRHAFRSASAITEHKYGGSDTNPLLDARSCGPRGHFEWSLMETLPRSYSQFTEQGLAIWRLAEQMSFGRVIAALTE